MAYKKIKILYILHSASVGGAPLSCLSLLKKMDREIYDPVALFLKDSRMVEIYRDANIHTIVDKSLSYFSHTTGERLYIGNPRAVKQLTGFLPSIVRTREIVSRIKPDIVHCNSSTLSAQVIGAKWAGAKVVWHIREHVVRGLSGIRQNFHYWVGNHYADALIFILEKEARRFACGTKGHLIPNFVDFDVFDRTLRERMNKKKNRRPTVIFLGAATPIKGALEFVLSYQLVCRAIGPVKFILAGADGGPSLPGMLSRIKQGALNALGRQTYSQKIRSVVSRDKQEGIIFLGKIEDVPSLLAASDLLVFPATAPHFARPVIEAAAMGLPVVASDLEGPRDLIKDRETGILVPPNDYRALAGAIIEVLADPDLARRLGESAYLMALRNFDANVNSRKVFDIYRRLAREI